MIKNVYVDVGCISCGTCESICPEVFQVDTIAHVKKDVDIRQYENLVKEAADLCPVQVIKIEKE